MHLDFHRVHGTGQGRPRHLAVSLDRVSVPNPEETARQRDGKIQGLPSTSSLQSSCHHRDAAGRRNDAWLVRCRPHVAMKGRRRSGRAGRAGGRSRSGSSCHNVARRPWGRQITASGLLVPPGTPSREIHLTRQFGSGGPAPAAGANPLEANFRVIPGSAPRIATGPQRAWWTVARAITGAEFLRLGQREGLLQRPPRRRRAFDNTGLSPESMPQDRRQVPGEVAAQGDPVRDKIGE